MIKNSHLKTDRFLKSSQFIKILTKREDFQERIWTLRKKYKIPKEGFCSEEESKKWHEEKEKELEDVIENNFNSSNGLKKNATLFKLQEDIKSLIIDFGLSENYDSTIEYFIKFNKISAPENIGVIMPFNEDLKRRQLFIQIFPDTTIDDVKRVWGRVLKFKKYLVGFKKNSRFREITTLSVQERVYDLIKAGKKPRQIADIFADEGKGNIGYEDIGAMINRYKKKVERKRNS